MSELRIYDVPLKSMTTFSAEYDYDLGSYYFSNIGDSDIEGGEVKSHVVVQKQSDSYELKFSFSGYVLVPCDRCLELMKQPVLSENRLVVKFGEEYREESDELIVVPEIDGFVNVAWYMFEFINLSIPMQHIHSEGGCNPEMEEKLRVYSADIRDNEENTQIDPRWDILKSIKKNN